MNVQPPELAQLLEFAERSRDGDWSLRAALTRYAQPEPQRVGDLLECVRRVEFAVHPQLKAIERDGATLWEALNDSSADAEPLVGLLRAAAELDRLADDVVAWACDPSQARPDAQVDAVTADVASRLDDLGIPREQRQRPTRSRG